MLDSVAGEASLLLPNFVAALANKLFRNDHVAFLLPRPQFLFDLAQPGQRAHITCDYRAFMLHFVMLTRLSRSPRNFEQLKRRVMEQVCNECNTIPPVRLFAGLMVAPEIAGELVRLGACLEGPSVRLVAVADVHVTLVPPWHEASVPIAIEKLLLAARACEPFWLAFQHLGYSPDPSRPRMLWADCVASEPISTLHASLLRAYGQTDERPFRPHVTLARIRSERRRIARAHPIDQALSFTQHIETVELFQSPGPGATGYRVVASAPLGETADSLPAQPIS
jgi:RNA 2',3'-cyclic 3'-phosphodiesterase